MKTKRSLLPTTYAPLLADLKARVRAAQVKAAVSVTVIRKHFPELLPPATK